MPTPERLRQLAEAAEPRAQFVAPFFLHPGPDVTEVLLIRHAQVAPSLGDDSGLTEDGQEQAEALAAHLASTEIDAVFASPTLRAQQTAAPTARVHGLDVVVVDGLRDVENHLPPGLSLIEAMEQRFGEAEAARRYELLVSNGLQFDVFEGLVESSQSLRARVVEAIEGIISANPGRRVAVFSHAPPIAAYVAHVMASPFDFVLYPRLTSISIVLARQERRQLQLLNATPHFGVL